jgi:hypothetical protein
MKTTKSILTVGLAIIFLALLGGWVVTRGHAAADAVTSRQLPDDEMQQLLRSRFDSATKALRTERTKFEKGTTTLETVYHAARRMREAELELSTTTDGQIDALTKHVALMRQFEQDVSKRIERGQLAVGDDETPRCWRLSAEVELLRAKRAATTAK